MKKDNVERVIKWGVTVYREKSSAQKKSAEKGKFDGNKLLKQFIKK
jgi:hypothetical protein